MFKSNVDLGKKNANFPRVFAWQLWREVRRDKEEKITAVETGTFPLSFIALCVTLTHGNLSIRSVYRRKATRIESEADDHGTSQTAPFFFSFLVIFINACSKRPLLHVGVYAPPRARQGRVTTGNHKQHFQDPSTVIQAHLGSQLLTSGFFFW